MDGSAGKVRRGVARQGSVRTGRRGVVRTAEVSCVEAGSGVAMVRQAWKAKKERRKPHGLQMENRISY